MMSKWKQPYVIFPYLLNQDIEEMQDRYNILVFEVDAPITQRWKRFNTKHNLEMSLGDFAHLDD